MTLHIVYFGHWSLIGIICIISVLALILMLNRYIAEILPALLTFLPKKSYIVLGGRMDRSFISYKTMVTVGSLRSKLLRSDRNQEISLLPFWTPKGNWNNIPVKIGIGIGMKRKRMRIKRMKRMRKKLCILIVPVTMICYTPRSLPELLRRISP